jgi:hypothetical protein
LNHDDKVSFTPHNGNTILNLPYRAPRSLIFPIGGIQIFRDLAIRGNFFAKSEILIVALTQPAYNLLLRTALRQGSAKFTTFYQLIEEGDLLGELG